MARNHAVYYETINGTEVNYFVIDGAPYVYCGDAMSAMGLHDRNGNYGLTCRRYLRKDTDYIDYVFAPEKRNRLYLNISGVFNIYNRYSAKNPDYIDDYYEITQRFNNTEDENVKSMWHICDRLAAYKRYGSYPVPEKKKGAISATRKPKESPVDMFAADLLEESIHEVKSLRKEFLQENISRLNMSITLFESITSLANKNRELARVLKNAARNMTKERDALMEKLKGGIHEQDKKQEVK